MLKLAEILFQNQIKIYKNHFAESQLFIFVMLRNEASLISKSAHYLTTTNPSNTSTNNGFDLSILPSSILRLKALVISF